MAARNILLHLDDEDALTLFAPAVLQLARELQVEELTAVAAAAVHMARAGPAFALPLLEERERDALDRLEIIQRRLHDAAKGFRLDWRSAPVADPTGFLLDQAARSDLIVTRRAAPGAPAFGSIDLGRLVLAAGRPVLVAPRATGALRFDRVLIGFKATREARVALSAALPLLCGARRVLVVAMGETTTAPQLQDAASFLGSHGIFAETRMLTDVDDPAAAGALLDLAETEGADLLVCGGYGRSRARELVFGGVTRDLLAQAPLACLFAH